MVIMCSNVSLLVSYFNLYHYLFRVFNINSYEINAHIVDIYFPYQAFTTYSEILRLDLVFNTLLY